MTTTTTGYLSETCPGYDEDTDTYFVASAPGADTWACPTCGTEWDVEISESGVPRAG